MRRWLTPVIEALDQRQQPLQVFVRDDDAGWDDGRLQRLVELCDRQGATLDLAAIPCALGVDMGLWLADRIGERLGCHQHGYSHTNHATAGRKCEFGPDRAPEQQLSDLRRGWMRLERLLDGRTDPLFTPPWNRCTQATADALNTLGLQALSRDAGAAPLRLGALQALPVHVDWMKHREPSIAATETPPAPDLTTLGMRLAEACRREPVLGLMLHHAVMLDADFDALGELIVALQQSRHVEFVTMRTLLRSLRAQAALRRSA